MTAQHRNRTATNRETQARRCGPGLRLFWLPCEAGLAGRWLAETRFFGALD